MKIRPVFLSFFLGIAVGITASPAGSQNAVLVPVPSRIVIDAGHGGKDFGAMSPLGSREKDLTLELAFMLRDRLRSEGHEVILTRVSDVFVPLSVRSNVSNKKQADLFVSIHANASTTKTLNGFEVYYLSDEINDAQMAQDRAARSVIPSSTARFYGDSPLIRQIVWEMKEAANRGQSKIGAQKIADAVDEQCVIAAKRLRQAKFQVLKQTECPAVLIEVGYISNLEDEERLSAVAYKRSMVDAIAEGISAYGREFKATGGFAR